MKSISKKTYDETIYTCDFCKKQSDFQPEVCVTCGIGACSDCWLEHLIFYDDYRPLHLNDRSYGTGSGLSRHNFCKPCYENPENKLADFVKELHKRRTKAIAQFDKFRLWANRWIPPAQRAIENNNQKFE